MFNNQLSLVSYRPPKCSSDISQFSSVSQLCLTLQPHGLQHARPPCPSPTPRVYSKLLSVESVMQPSSFSRLQSFPTSGSLPISQFFASGGQSIGSFSFSISPSNEYLGTISFRIDRLDLLAVQGTLKSLLQHHSSKASIWCSAFFIVQLTSIHDYWSRQLCWQSNVSAF